MYTFRAIDDQNLMSGTSLLINVDVVEFNGNREEYRKDSVEFRGKLLALFGKPVHSSSLSDEAFDYVLEATNERGESLILTAYEGASGPAIGALSSSFGGNDQLNEKAAFDLIALIKSTSPADFESVVYDDDTNNTVWYGVKDGTYYRREERGDHRSEDEK